MIILMLVFGMWIICVLLFLCKLMISLLMREVFVLFGCFFLRLVICSLFVLESFKLYNLLVSLMVVIIVVVLLLRLCVSGMLFYIFIWIGGIFLLYKFVVCFVI